jgi:hypothetical protein
MKIKKYLISQTTTLTKSSLTHFIQLFWDEIFATSNKRQPQYVSMELPNGSPINVYTHTEPYNYSDLEGSSAN